MDESELEEELRNFGVDVHDVDEVDPVELSYITAYPGDEVNHMEMGKVLNAFLDMEEDDDWEATRVEATVLRFEDEVLNTWHAKAEWFEGLREYRISETEFSTRVLETLEEDLE
ncbi:hypothetical protein SAMN04488065_1992 [Haloplanus vescus]|uniref:DUF8159 domain-containing protein n=1 Tax=Haloplanus vescus TaxID=555874 RepID=A0A1H3YN15_9EURY|nr:hypothetical protein [Haloplanus vescus]SEA12925.1 hypothetical protein SAMN04488065_1992 [Haloplanus vescus]